ncbi:MAG: ABC transporter permease [Bryobacterales bacterium]|nr:ABC transporter permease [Bryobacterales bacterium]
MSFLVDVRHGLRTLSKGWSYSLLAVCALGMGIAINATVFSWMDGIWLHALPGVGDAGELYVLETVTEDGKLLGNFSYRDYLDYRDQLRSADGVAVARVTPLSAGIAGQPERIWGELVSGNYFQLLRVQPVMGRAFNEAELAAEPGGLPVAVISHSTWKNRFGADPQIVGKAITVNFQQLTIVGVAPANFNGSTPGLRFDLWMPVTMATAMGTGTGTLRFRGTRDLTTTMMRLKPGVPFHDAADEVLELSQRLAAAEPRTNQGIRVVLTPLREASRGSQQLLRAPLRLLMGICLLVFLIVCANVASLMLIRFTQRRRELGIRMALGAQPWRLLREMMTETLLLAMAGAMVGLLLSNWMHPVLGLMLPLNDFPIAVGGHMSWLPVAFTAGILVVATLICGGVPAVAALRQNLNLTLKESSRADTGGRGTGRLRHAIVVAEVTLATVAVIGTGLFAASFRNALVIHPGFRTENLLVGQFYLSPMGYTGKQQREFCRDLRQRLEAGGDVAEAVYADQIPLYIGPSPWHQIAVEGYTPAEGENMNVHRTMVSPGYFKLLEIPLLEGRDFDERDKAGEPDVVIVNESFARKYFGGVNPVGRRIRLENRWANVVGLARDAKYHSPTESSMPYFYRAFQQGFEPGLNFSFFVKPTGDPALAATALQKVALEVDNNARVVQPVLLADSVRLSLYPLKVAAVLIGGLGAVGLLLAMMGVFGVVSQAVAGQVREIAIRMALGANQMGVLMAFIGRGVVVVVVGMVLGLGTAWILGSFADSMLVGVQSHDALVALVGMAVLLACGILATLMPAWRATQVQPANALRKES